MADKLLYSGYNLFTGGFTSNIQWIRLYTQTGVLVDEQPVTFTYQTDKIEITADVVFEVPASTNDVSYVIVGRTQTPLDFLYYRKMLDVLYDFTTAGTLTIDSFTFAVTGAPLQPDGREALFTTGWSSYITQIRINNSGGAIDTKPATFGNEIKTVTGYCTIPEYTSEITCINNGGLWETEAFDFELQAQVNLDVGASVSGINNAQLLNAGGDVFWSKTLPSPAPYSFTTAGELRIKTWVFSI